MLKRLLLTTCLALTASCFSWTSTTIAESSCSTDSDADAFFDEVSVGVRETCSPTSTPTPTTGTGGSTPEGCFTPGVVGIQSGNGAREPTP